MKFLMVGLGGIGQRHLRNLRALYGDRCDIIAYRVRRDSPVLNDALQIDQADGLEERYGVRSFSTLEDALNERPTAALICNPSSLHIPIALAAARAGCHLLIEKPLSDSMESIDPLSRVIRSENRVCMVAYQMRFHPALRRAHELLTSGAIGRPVACRAIVGEHLPSWHRYEDYRTMYASQRSLGGGVVLSQIHELDMLYWFFGRPKQIFALGGHWSDLEIDVEDVASTLFSYEGMVAHLHQDYLQQPPMRQFEIVGSVGKISVDFRALTVHAHGGSGQEILGESFPGFERNSLFQAELKCFVDAIDHGTPVPVDLEAGRHSLEMALAIRRSIDSGERVDMKGPPWT
jgi:predicted dehydrogenase